MVRVKRGNVARKRRKKVLKRAKGFTGSLSRLFRPAKQAVMHAMSYATADRRTQKGNIRKLWITRINGALRQFNISYNKFINGLKKKKIVINRKMLSDLAIFDPKAFAKIVESVK
ncbi:MAG: large subunit ribosomal protein L20 [Candidatus Saganbacteria bacterium]|uniref:Large ribosomal subunit protein bL20 n=1 Tax=Candidatus Saganbacteria bacterium TaxID=2575572 RepID=A0A833L254_UNCSA|nr:MAG: large subunit ribosomal protein L20 [Candidatus Saganbacteria bacterium]